MRLLHLRSCWTQALLFLHLAGHSSQFRCYKTDTPPLLNAQLIDCPGQNSCHEYFYAFYDADFVTYIAGCGLVKPNWDKMTSQKHLVAGKDRLCYKDSCNDELMQELKKTHRICSYVKASRVLGRNKTVACLPQETRCFLDQANAPVPFYHAGCGPCPGYTLSCLTCTLDQQCTSPDDEADINWKQLGMTLVAAKAELAKRSASKPTAETVLLLASFTMRRLLR